jgi:DNA-binding response OmpR family regulator
MQHEHHRSILVVEDEALLAMDLEVIVGATGSQVCGPATSIAEALRLVRECRPDAAILDLNLAGEMIFPVADVLVEAGIPFIILSGHSQESVPSRYRNRPFLSKPYNPEDLLAAIHGLFPTAPDGAHGIAHAG